jgi:hypothetical protein
MHFAEIAVAVLLAIVAFIAGVRFGIWMYEYEIAPVKKDKTHMLPAKRPMLTAEKYEQRIKR